MFWKKVYSKTQALVNKVWAILDHDYVPVLRTLVSTFLTPFFSCNTGTPEMHQYSPIMGKFQFLKCTFLQVSFGYSLQLSIGLLIYNAYIPRGRIWKRVLQRGVDFEMHLTEGINILFWRRPDSSISRVRNSRRIREFILAKIPAKPFTRINNDSHESLKISTVCQAARIHRFSLKLLLRI